MELEPEVTVEKPEKDTKCIYSGSEILKNDIALCFKAHENKFYVSRSSADEFADKIKELSEADDMSNVELQGKLDVKSYSDFDDRLVIGNYDGINSIVLKKEQLKEFHDKLDIGDEEFNQSIIDSLKD